MIRECEGLPVLTSGVGLGLYLSASDFTEEASGSDPERRVRTIDWDAAGVQAWIGFRYGASLSRRHASGVPVELMRLEKTEEAN